MDARVDQAGREVEPAAIDGFDAVGCARGEELRAEVGDLAVADQDGAAILRIAQRIDDARVDVGGRAAVRRRGPIDVAAHGLGARHSNGATFFDVDKDAPLEWRAPSEEMMAFTAPLPPGR